MDNKVLDFLAQIPMTNVYKYGKGFYLWYRIELEFISIQKRDTEVDKWQTMRGTMCKKTIKTALEQTIHRLSDLISEEKETNYEGMGGIKQSYNSMNNNKEMKEYDGNKNDRLVVLASKFFILARRV